MWFLFPASRFILNPLNEGPQIRNAARPDRESEAAPHTHRHQSEGKGCLCPLPLSRGEDPFAPDRIEQNRYREKWNQR